MTTELFCCQKSIYLSRDDLIWMMCTKMCQRHTLNIGELTQALFDVTSLSRRLALQFTLQFSLMFLWHCLSGQLS